MSRSSPGRAGGGRFGWLRYVVGEARQYREIPGYYYPWCRGKRHDGVGWPRWHISWQGGNKTKTGQYWCAKCLPDKYRAVAQEILDEVRLQGDDGVRTVRINLNGQRLASGITP